VGELPDLTRRFGRLPGLAVVVPFFVLLILAALVSSGTATVVMACVLLAVLLVYCVARRRRGLDVFCSSAVPGAVSTLLHDLAGTPSWIGFVLIPVALVLVWGIDNDEAAGADAVGRRAVPQSADDGRSADERTRAMVADEPW